MRFLGVAGAALVLFASAGMGVAEANQNDQVGKQATSATVTIQDQFFGSQAKFDEVLKERSPARVVVADSGGVVVLTPTSRKATLGGLLKRNGFSLDEYHSDEGKTVRADQRLKPETTLFLFKQEQASSFKKIKLPAPVEEVESDSIEAGSKVVLSKGKEGAALLTKVTTRDLSQSRELNRKAGKKTKSEDTVETITVVRPPQARVVLVGTGLEDEEIVEDSAPLEATPDGLVNPIAGASLTSPFGMRVHPITRIFKLHDGNDFGASCGTPVRAITSGTVTHASYQGGYGNQVEIDYGGGFESSYSHLSTYTVDTGEKVKPGDIVGLVGSTGYSTGCHLHFMTIVNGEPVDSREFFADE